MLLHEKVMLCLHEKDALSVDTFIKDGTSGRYCYSGQEFMEQPLGEKSLAGVVDLHNLFGLQI